MSGHFQNLPLLLLPDGLTDKQTDRQTDGWMTCECTSHHILKAMWLKSSTKFSEKVKYEIGHFFNVKFSRKSNGPMENSNMYSGIIEYKAVYMLTRLQDCSYNSFKNFHKVLSKCMKNVQFLNFKVSPKSSGSTEFSETYCGNVEYHP